MFEQNFQSMSQKMKDQEVINGNQRCVENQFQDKALKRSSEFRLHCFTLIMGMDIGQPVKDMQFWHGIYSEPEIEIRGQHPIKGTIHLDRFSGQEHCQTEPGFSPETR